MRYIKPSKLIGNIYFAGVYEASTHLIDTGNGLILIDPGYAESYSMVSDNIRALGFQLTDIRYILLSHGHGDHAEATPLLKAASGAKVFLGAADVPLLKGKFQPDVLLTDGSEITLGNTTVRCVSTPGHTDGTMSFFFDVEVDGKVFRAGMHGGAGTNTLTSDFLTRQGLPFENRQKFFDSLSRLEQEKVDIFLGNHVWNNATDKKIEALATSRDNPFLAPEEWKEFLAERRSRLQALIEREAAIAETARRIEKEQIIVIVRGVEEEKLIPLAQAMYDGGIRLIEITYDASGRVSSEETARRLKLLCDRFGDAMLVGAGTVMTEKQVLLTKNAGGRFIISPNTDAALIRKTKALDMVSIPGALTPTEIAAARQAGADFVKVFPASVMGPDYLKAVSAPLSNVRLLAVGGVDEKNMADYLAAGACGIGVGSGIVDKKLLVEENYAGITALARKYTEARK